MSLIYGMCGIKISAVHCLVLSQSTRVTVGQTDRQTVGQNKDSQDRANIAASRGKNGLQPAAQDSQPPRVNTQ